MKQNKIPYYILFAISAALYLNTIPNHYAIDDKMIIYKNIYTQKGVSGIGDILTKDAMAGMFGDDSNSVAGGRYRPLSMISFAIEHEMFGANPHISHLINLLLYAISVVILYRLLLHLFREQKAGRWYAGVAFLSALIFAVHPLHTDAVANIKGRDEIMCFLFVLLAWEQSLRYVEVQKLRHLLVAFGWFLLAVFSKETAITFLFVIPISFYFFRNAHIKTYFKIFLPIVMASALYMIVRLSVIGNTFGQEITELMNNPFLGMSFAERYATVFYTLGIYLKLLFFPHPLTWDYYPYHIPVIGFSDIRALLPLFIYVVLGVIAVVGTFRKSPYAFAIWVYLATLSITSNLLFSIGAFMSERFVYMSLLGFCLALAFAVNRYFLSTALRRKIAFVFLGVLVLAFSVRTVARNFNWKDNLTLFGHDVNISVNSAKGNSSYASELYSLAEQQTDTAERNRILKQAIPYFEKALSIYPSYTESLIRLGNCYYIMHGDYKTMFAYYLKALSVDPESSDVWGNSIGVMVNNVNDPQYEIFYWTEVIKRNTRRFEPFFFVGEHYRLLGQQPDSAVYYLSKAAAIAPNNFDVLKSLGIVYGSVNEFDKARDNLLKAVTIKTDDAECFRYIGLTYGVQGDDAKALEYFEKAYAINPNDEQNLNNVILARKRLGL